jgi:hypothetical protein
MAMVWTKDRPLNNTGRPDMDGTTLAEEVLAYLAGEGIELSEDLEDAETVLRDRLLAIGAQVLQKHLEMRKLGYEGSTRRCSCGGSQRFVEYRPKTISSLLGDVTIRRAYYRCGTCKKSALPYDERVGLGTGQVSPGLAKAGTLVGIAEPFVPSAQMLYELTGRRISARTIERLTQQVGTLAEREESAGAERIKTWNPPVAEVTPERLYVAVDGVLVHENDGYHEAKTATCYWENAEGKREARYTVRFECAATFAAFVWVLACRCGLGTAKQIVLLGDGAKWIWDHIAPVLEGAICIVDWYHAMEHVWDCGKQLLGEQTAETTAWVKAIEGLLWDGNVREILTRLRTELAQDRSPAQQAVLGSLITYLENQDDRLAYDRFRALGLDIGSGRVEAACKSVVGIRMKRSGMRWSRRGSQTVLSLRVARLNGQWQALWAKLPLAA